MNVRVSSRLAAVLAVLAAAVALPLVLGALGGAAPPPVPLVKVLADPFEDGLGYHGSAEEPSIFAARNPARAGGLAGSSTIVATEQVGRIYDGGASDIGYQVSVDGGKSWKHGELPLTMQGGVSDTCAGQLNRASDTVTVYDQKHDVWSGRLAGQELDHLRQLAGEQGLRQLLRRIRQQRKRQPDPDAGHARQRPDVGAGT